MEKTGKIIIGFAGGLAALIAILKGTSLLNFAKQLTISPKIDGGIKNISVKSGNLIIPLAIEFENKTDQELTIALTNIIVRYNGNEVGTLKPNSKSVKILKYQASKLDKLELAIPLSNLIKYAGQAITTLLTTQNIDKVIECLQADIQFILNNSIVCDYVLKFGETSTVDVKGSTQGIRGLGVTASHQRKLKPFSDYEMYIPPKTELYNKNFILFPNGRVEDTVALMKKVCREFAPDTEILAKHLEKATLTDTIQSIFNFVYNYIQYVPDSTTTEQVRRPLRTLWDRKGDCDCFATLIGSILTNLNIPFKFRIAAYNGRENFQHVYVIIPNGSKYYVCDPVLDRCFYEKPPSKRMDF